MKQGRNIKIFVISLIMAGAIAGFACGMSAAPKTGGTQTARPAMISAGTSMVPGNFRALQKILNNKTDCLRKMEVVS